MTDGISYRRIDADAMSFLKNYYLKLCQFNSGKFWDYRINSMINKYLNPVFNKYENQAIMPIEFTVATLPTIGQYLPPACQWISISKTFSVHNLDYIIGYQYYVLWDILRKEFFPWSFHDLIAVDEIEDHIYGRLHPNSKIEGWNIFKMDPDWIEIEENIEHIASINNIDELEIDDSFKTDGGNSVQLDQYELSNIYQCPDFEMVFKKEQEIIIKTNNEKLKIQAVKNILNHPLCPYEQDNDLLDHLDTKLLNDTTIELIKNVMAGDFDEKDDLPF